MDNDFRDTISQKRYGRSDPSWALARILSSRRMRKRLAPLTSDDPATIKTGLNRIGDIANRAYGQLENIILTQPSEVIDGCEADIATFCGLAAPHIHPLLKHPVIGETARQIFDSLKIFDVGNGKWSSFQEPSL